MEHQHVAYWNVCRHIPIPLDAGMGYLHPGPEWVCKTHGARFRATDGVCVEGPCEGLKLYTLDVHVQDGQLWASGDVPNPVS